MTVSAYVNRIATAVPPHDVHAAFIGFADRALASDTHRRRLFARMAEKSDIAHRFSFFAPATEPNSSSIDDGGFYRSGGFPGTGARMRLFEEFAPLLARQAVENLLSEKERGAVTHLLVTCCTGFAAPGIDFVLMEKSGLPNSVERTTIGFMGCHAAINALKLARHIVRSDPRARVLTLNIELCTLHLKETADLEQMLSFLLFGDGCAASLVSADPHGVALDDFRAVEVPDTRDLITWRVGDLGFDMVLSGRVPAAVFSGLDAARSEILGNVEAESFVHWAVHPGGRTILDAVERAFALPSEKLSASRDILRRYGNMSSATVMFVLKQMLDSRFGNGDRGCAMAFGPGIVAETMRFRLVA